MGNKARSDPRSGSDPMSELADLHFVCTYYPEVAAAMERGEAAEGEASLIPAGPWLAIGPLGVYTVSRCDPVPATRDGEIGSLWSGAFAEKLRPLHLAEREARAFCRAENIEARDRFRRERQARLRREALE